MGFWNDHFVFFGTLFSIYAHNITLSEKNSIVKYTHMQHVVHDLWFLQESHDPKHTDCQILHLDTNGGPGTRGPQILARITSSFKLGGPPGTLNL